MRGLAKEQQEQVRPKGGAGGYAERVDGARGHSGYLSS